MTSDRSAVILSAVRTPMGKHGGILKDVRPDDMAARVIEEAIRRASVEPGAIDEVVLGCANQSGEDNRNVGRMAAILAGLPFEVPGLTINRLCASGLDSIIHAYRAIVCGELDIVVAGGVESMTRAPFAMPKPVTGFARGNVTVYDTALGWRFENPAMAARFPLEGMGNTAENVVAKYGIGRDEQDRFAYRSHQRAIAAAEKGTLAEEILPMTVPAGKGATATVSMDEGPRPDTSIEKLAKLRPVFVKDGSVTAGNSSQISDGAGALVLASADAARRLGVAPLATIVASAAAGVHPGLMGLGPVAATDKLFARSGHTWKDVDLIELNEAFAGQALGVFRGWGMPEEVWDQKVNVNGGAIALGHPLGASGARLVATLVHELRRRKGRLGLATLCVGVGQGVALLVDAA